MYSPACLWRLCQRGWRTAELPEQRLGEGRLPASLLADPLPLPCLRTEEMATTSKEGSRTHAAACLRYVELGTAGLSQGQNIRTSRLMRRTRPRITLSEAVYKNGRPEDKAIHSSDHQSPHCSQIPANSADSKLRLCFQADPESMASECFYTTHPLLRDFSKLCPWSARTRGVDDISTYQLHLYQTHCGANPPEQLISHYLLTSKGHLALQRRCHPW